MVCKICNKDVNTKGFSSHLKTHNITSKEYYDTYFRQDNEGICPVCGKDTPFLKISKGYQKHCCMSCALKNEETQNKIATTRLKKYGVTNFFQNKDIHNKAETNAHSEIANNKKKQTSLKHYGVENPMQSKEVVEKVQQTNLQRYGSRSFNRNKGKQTMVEKYGHEYALQVPEFKIKQANTCIERFGVNNVYASAEIRSKIELTNIEKYGVDNPYKSAEIRDKIKQVNISRYGVEYPMQSDEIKSKAKFTNIEKYGTEYPMQNDTVKSTVMATKNVNIEQFSKDNECTTTQELLKLYGSGWHQSKLGKELEFVYNGISFVKNCNICKIEQYSSENHSSNYENELYELLTTFNLDIVQHSRSVIKPQELDFYIESLNLAIEFNGMYWHSIEAGTPIDYHLIKSIKCREKGIRLIHIYEFEDFEVQKQLLSDLILGHDNYPTNDFNKNNLIEDIPKPEIIFSKANYTVYGAGRLF